MDITIAEEADGVVLEIDGRITMRNSHELLEAIKKQLKKGAARIMIQLGKVDYMDSSGVGVLITGMKLAKKTNATIGLVSLTTRVKQVMDMSGLGQVFPVFDSVEAAREGLR